MKTEFPWSCWPRKRLHAAGRGRAAAHFDHYDELDPNLLAFASGSGTAQSIADLIASNDPYWFRTELCYNVAPVSDNAPFFFFTLKARQILGPEAIRDGIDWKVNLECWFCCLCSSSRW